jgi:hypothetical protein
MSRRSYGRAAYFSDGAEIGADPSAATSVGAR